MDQHVPRAITIGLRLRGIDVITAFEDEASEMTDSALLDRAGEIGRVLFTQDDNLLAEAAERQKEGKLFYGVVYAHQLRSSIGACVKVLELISIELILSESTAEHKLLNRDRRSIF